MECFTISLDGKVAAAFDELIKERGYATRSEAVRDILRAHLQQSAAKRDLKGSCVANLSYVYNHHERELAERLTIIQHAHHDLTVSTMHAHLDHDQCIETVMLKGPVKRVREFAEEIIAERGADRQCHRDALNETARSLRSPCRQRFLAAARALQSNGHYYLMGELLHDDLTRRHMTLLALLAPFASVAKSAEGETPSPAHPQQDHDMSSMPASWTRPDQIAMLVYPKMTALDLIGPQYLFASLMGATVHLVGQSLAPVTSDTGVTITPTVTFENCPRELTVLFAPGGTNGTLAAMQDAATLAFMADRGSRARYVTSVCTGSLILGATGLLNGYKATSHWSARDVLADLSIYRTLKTSISKLALVMADITYGYLPGHPRIFLSSSAGTRSMS